MTDQNDFSKYSNLSVNGYPVRHKKKDLSKLNVLLSRDSREKIYEIKEMDRELGNFVLSKNDFMNLVSEAHASNVHWSTKLEGNRLPLNEVRKSSRRILESKDSVQCCDPGPNQEIINHLYSYFLHDEFDLPWNVSIVCRLHKFLMTGTGEPCEPGEIRSSEMSVYSEDGTETFQACPMKHVEMELNELLEWIDRTPLDPVVSAIIFFHEFESIHPFTEGNGRTGRTLLHILMQEYGLQNFNLCILDVKLLENSSVYYSLMEYTDDSGDYTPIVEFFVDCIYRAYSEAIELFGSKDLLKDMDDNSWCIVQHARDSGEWFSVNDAVTWNRDQGEQTVRNRLSKLITMGILEKEGCTRSTRFRYIDPLRDISDYLKRIRLFEKE